MRILSAFVFLLALCASSSAQNLIVQENQLPGTPRSTWDLSGPGSDNIEGFTDDISVNHGSTINFKIRTASNNFRIDIYRLGYYQGDGARLVETIQVTTAQNQPDPIYNAPTGTYDAGNWSVSASWAVPSSAVSGVYLAKLTRQDGPFGENQIAFIVRADESHSDIVFQTSDTTWQAYNAWDGEPCSAGGTSLYSGNGPGGGDAKGRAYAVSYNRPITTRAGCGGFAGPWDYLFGAEYAAIYWLERNGYDVSYISGVDTARYPALLLNHKLFTSTGHDEYWAGEQRDAVEAAREAGVNLAFMSGNEVYWKTRWGPSYDGSTTPYRTLICYKETREDGRIDPANTAPTWTWTGTWRDLRYSPPSDGGRPENALTGTMFTVDSYRSDAITVPYPQTLLRFWRNTDVADTPIGQSTTLTENLLGYEWDESPDNGFTPPGLIFLSSTTVDVGTFLLDYGKSTGDGTAFHHLTLYKHPSSGAIVFSAGTVYWSWGLAAQNDGPPTPTDRNVQQAMVNLFAEMDIQPLTLQADLVPATKSTDASPPTSALSSPLDGSVFTTGQTITISGSASDSGGRVAGVEISWDGGATWHKAESPSFGLGSANWSYDWTPASAGTYVIKSRATDDSLNTETPGAGRQITVNSFGTSLFLSTEAPSIINENDPNAIGLGVKFSSSVPGIITALRFYKNPIDFGVPNLPPHTAQLWTLSGTLLASATFTNETASGWQQVNLAAPVPIEADTTYIASYHSNGNYPDDEGFFLTSRTNGPLTAPSSAASGGNGLYSYGTGVVFPTGTYHQENYWVDVVFSATAPGVPIITSALSASATVGTPFSYTITATNDPTSFDATGLPAGLSVNTTTGVISGTPTASGSFNVDLSATNAVGTGNATLALTVDTPAVPTVTSALSANATVGTPFSYTITASANPTSFDATGLPAGLSVNTATGVISGTPTASGSFNVELSATNAIGTGTANLALTVFGSGFSLFLASDVPATVNVNDPNAVELGVKFTAASDGDITAIRFYKGSQDTGTHTGHLWSASGTLLASATFANETASGWQQVYLNSPVPITADTTYVVSYHTDGNYSASEDYFATQHVNGPLTAPSDSASGGNGVYRYGGVAFPDLSYQASNYWVDVVFSSSTPAVPVITSALSANATVGTPFSYTITATNDPTSFDATGLPAGLSVNTTTGVISGTPTASGSFNVELSATNAAGTGNATLALTVDAPAVPVVTSALTANATVGTPFSYTITATNSPTSFDATGLPAGLSVNTATGVISGTPSASGSFNVDLSATNAAGTGNATLALTVAPAGAPVVTSALTANATVGSPFSYTITATNSPTSFDATGLPAGLSVNTTTGVISGTPTASGSFNVDLSATNAAGTGNATLALTVAPSEPPVVTSALTANATVGTPFSYTITATNDPTSFGATGLPAGLSVNTTTGVISGTPTASGLFNIDLSATNVAGTGNATLALTVDPEAPVVTSALTANATVGSPFSYTITATNSPTSFDATGLPAGLSVNTATGVISGTPTVSGSFNVDLSATNATGTGTATLALTVFGSGFSLFLASDVPATVNVNDPSAVELGVKFTAASDGDITAIRFYKGSQDTGTHTGHLWSASGTLLASATFANETASGWQQVDLSTPVAITAGATYVVSYHTNGNYSVSQNYFASQHVNGPLTAPSDSASGGNGVYRYGGVAFPAFTYQASNYWVDVVFSPAAPGVPVITSALTANATDGSPFSYTITATDNPTSFDATGLPAGLSINTATGVISGTPTASGSFNVDLSATNATGTGNATLALSVIGAGSSLFLASDVPATVNVNDPNAVELGVKFTAAGDGDITAIRFYKGSQDTGTHTAHLWSASGTLLASAIFANETASGWQQVNLSTPVAITAGTTYVASYHTNGNYSVSQNYFATQHVNGPLTAPSSSASGGNGVYRYGGVAFPDLTYQASNYWVDVVFVAAPVGE